MEPSCRYLRTAVRLLLVMALLGVGVALLVLEIQAGGTAYIVGEGLWSKAQKDAANRLYRYAGTGNVADLAATRRSLAVPLGDRAARLALDADPPDIEAAVRGFRQGGNADDDIGRLIRLYRYFSWAPYFHNAIQIWRAGDEGILQLSALADEVQAAYRDGQAPSPSQVQAFQRRATELSDALRPLEAAFSASMRQGVQQLHVALMLFSSGFVLLIAWAGIIVVRWMQRRIRSSEGRFRAAFDQAVVGMLKLATDGQVIEVNETFARLLGTETRWLRRRPLELLVHPDDWQALDVEDDGGFCWKALKEPAEMRFLRTDGQAIWCRWTASPCASDDELGDYILLILEDVSEARALEDDLVHQARHDALTGLPNRREIERQLQLAMDQCNADGHEHTLCFVDVDQFKLVNDTRGHVVGDQLLCRIARMLPLGLRESDLVGRLGGDEFAILLRNTDPKRGLQIAEKLRVDLEQMPLGRDEGGFGLSVSVGVVAVSRDTPSVDWLLSAADSACYLAKDEGRNRVHLYRESDEAMTRRRNEMEWVAEIRAALEEHRLELYAQRLEVRAGSALQYEVLVRLRGNDGRIYSPGAFLPAAERYHQSEAIDRFVFRRLVQELDSRPAHLQRLELCHVNVSAQSITQPSFRVFVVALLQRCPQVARRICFEITETGVVSNLVEARSFIDAVRREGCRVALDDFGNGLSSFGYLKNLDIDVLKLDQIFVRDLGHNAVDEALVRLISEVGHTLGKVVVAEGAESTRAVAVLRDIGVDAIQGYAIHRPCPLMELMAPDQRAVLRASA